VPRAWDLAATFADAGLVPEDLDRFAEDVPEAVRADALGWVACRLTVQRIVNEIASSAGRISQLVGSVKTYTHMDRSPEHKPTDVRDGLDNTLTLLDHKLRQKAVRLVRDYDDDLPLVSGNAGQLNQVWTSLVDNAIDAVGASGEIRVGARRRDAYIEVTVRDNGHGIPPEIQHRIFEPFFTTKGVGEGTGLGLGIATGIVKTHRGSLSVQSKAGETEAHVRLPAPPASL
jgi:signal transduction histidine kinase